MVALIQRDPDFELTDKLLHFDSLDTAEKLTGKSYKGDEDTAKLGFALHIKNNEIKKLILESQDDMTFCGSLSDYLRITRDLGFVPVLEESFKGDPVNETYFIYWHPTKSILLAFESCQGERINSAKWYFSYKPNSVDLMYSTDFHCSGGWYGARENLPKDQWIWIGSWDAREAIRHQMKKFDEYGSFVTQWPQPRLLQLNTYMDWKKCPDHNYSSADQETKRRFNLLPEYVRKAIVGHGRD